MPGLKSGQTYSIPVQGIHASTIPWCDLHNVIATKRGHKRPDEIIVVGAHYDTAGNPGADDNASGIAGALELARMLADVPTEHTFQFVAFVNEERPYFQTELMGSRVFASAAKQQGANIKLAVVLEMLGHYSEEPNSQEVPKIFMPFFPTTGNFIAAIADDKAMPFLNKISKEYKQKSTVPMKTNNWLAKVTTLMPECGFSDHWSFWKEGYPAIMITDTAFLRKGHNYHKQTDTYDILNYEYMANVVNGLAYALGKF